MLKKNTGEEEKKALYDTLLRLKTHEDCEALFTDLCTRKELEQMAMRLAAARLLMEGKTYSTVMSQVKISSATLSRVSRCVQYGTGYNTFVVPDRSEQKNDTEISE